MIEKTYIRVRPKIGVVTDVSKESHMSSKDE